MTCFNERKRVNKIVQHGKIYLQFNRKNSSRPEKYLSFCGFLLAHIQQLLGHENLSTTSGFYAFVTLDTLAKTMNKSNPDTTTKRTKRL